jgi:hypothetical protein
LDIGHLRTQRDTNEQTQKGHDRFSETKNPKQNECS